MQKLLYLICFCSLIFNLGYSQSNSTVFINEIRYLSEDPAARGIEIANLEDTDLSGWTIYLYNSSGAPYDTIPLVGSSANTPFQDESNVIIFVDIMLLSTNNGSGVALTDEQGRVVQYLTYCGEEAQTAEQGPASGHVSEVIGCQEGDNTPQLVGSGHEYGSFYWTVAPPSAGNINDGQLFTSPPPPPGSVLPVEWLSFTAAPQKTGIQLTWATATEYDSEYFILERSQDGRIFERVQTIASKGESSQAQHYSFLDQKAKRGVNYYRISQVDFGGELHTYKVIEAELDRVEQFSIYPNPAVQDILIDLPTTTEDVNVRIFNRMGQVVMQQTFSADSGLLNMNVSDLPAGYYMLVAQTGETMFSQKLLKQ